MFWQRFTEECERIKKKPNPVARELGISSGSVTGWKNGSIPNKKTLDAMAEYFNVSVDYLKGITDVRNPISGFTRIPVLGSVSAGIPFEAIEDIIDYEDIPEAMARTGEFFGLRIKGASMEPRILDGDTVIVRRQPDVESGEVAIVLVNGDEATCKKVIKNDEGISLIALNPIVYTPHFYTNKEIAALPVTILGKVVELRGKF